MKKKIFIAFIIICSMALFGVTRIYTQNGKINISDLYKQVELFSDAVSLINANYVDVVDPKNLIYGSLKGMLSSLDGYSQFMDPEAFKEMKIDTKGSFGGIGIEIGIRDDMLTIISPIDGTPAHKAGLAPEDVIVKIDNQSTKDVVLYEAVKKLRGKPGTSVALGIWREKEGRFFDVTIVREIIEIKSVKESKVFEDNIGYIKLVEFQEKTVKELEGALKALKAKFIKGLILDLRNNPGGLLDSAVETSDLFLEKGKLIVETKGREPSINRIYESRNNPIMKDETLVVLVNEGSASASEIVAGAIKDNQRGIIVGTKTFGKGSVQTVVPLKDGSALRITTAEYFTPGGYSIRKTGIMPNIVVDYEPPPKQEGEEREKKHIFEDLEKQSEPKERIEDNQIKAAINIIKGINIYKAKEK